jgi:hypothetical protein
MGIRLQRGLHALARVHRWLGIGLCALFVIWFASGIAMVYYRPPLLSDAERLDFARPLAGAADARAPSARPAADVPALAAAWPAVETLRLARVGNRLVYRWLTADGWQAAWADDGTLARFDGSALAAEARRWFGRSDVRFAGAVNGDTQWTFFGGARPHLPLLRFTTGGPLHRDVYFSSRTGEPVVATTPGARLLYLLGPGLHYFSFEPLRNADAVWRAVVIGTSSLGVVLCSLGLVLGVARLRLRRWWAGRARAIPYAAPAMRLHHWTGLTIGALGLTFVASGLLSMNPAQVFPSTSVGPGLASSVLGPVPPLAAYPAPDFAGSTRELHWYRLGGHPRLIELESIRVRNVLGTAAGGWRQVAAPTEAAAIEAARAAVAATSGSPIERAEWLSQFDNHYYARKERHRPLPAVRVVSTDGRWFYFDGLTGEPLLTSNAGTRARRWLYNGLHSFDLQVLLSRPRLWETTVWAASVAGLAFAWVGMWLAFGARRSRRVRRPGRPGTLRAPATFRQ